jgi:hypothetical protein
MLGANLFKSQGNSISAAASANTRSPSGEIGWTTLREISSNHVGMQISVGSNSRSPGG